MRFSIIASVKDIAGINIRDSLHRLYNFNAAGMFRNTPFYRLMQEDREIFLYTLDIDTIFFESIESEIGSDYYIFATRHQSKSGDKTLSVHVPGNYGKAEYGGTEGKLCTCPAGLMKTAFLILNQKGADSSYKLTLEASHHGPLIRKPVMFIEIGSREEQWKDKAAADFIASTIIETINSYEEKKYETAIGFGGLHYCSNFNKYERDDKTAMSHICPKYNMQFVDEAMIIKMINATYEKTSRALIDWKGIPSNDKQKLIVMLDKLDIKWYKIK